MFKRLFVLALPVLLIVAHVYGYESRARMNFEPLDGQNGITAFEIEAGEPLWFRDMSRSSSAIAVVKATEVKTCGFDKHVCADVDVNMQNSAWPGQSDHYMVRLTMEAPEHEAGPFTIKWSDNLKPMVVWNADDLKRGIRTNQSVVNEAKMH